jgi:hypothetical protein
VIFGRGSKYETGAVLGFFEILCGVSVGDTLLAV